MYVARLVASVLLLPAALAAQSLEAPNTIMVNATVTVEREPDRARLTLAVQSEGATADAASQANAKLMSRVIAALRENGLSGSAVRTTSIRVNPRYARTGGEQRVTGYEAVNSVEVTIDSIARVGTITDAAIAAGANRVAGLSFELKRPLEARIEALAGAMDRAREEAKAVAVASGHDLGPALRIEVDPQPDAVRFSAMAARADVMATMLETPIESGTIRISATVHVTYRMDAR